MIENTFCMRIYAVPCGCSTMPGGMGLDQMMKTTKVLVFFCMVLYLVVLLLGSPWQLNSDSALGFTILLIMNLAINRGKNIPVVYKWAHLNRWM